MDSLQNIQIFYFDFPQKISGGSLIERGRGIRLKYSMIFFSSTLLEFFLIPLRYFQFLHNRWILLFYDLKWLLDVVWDI